jgi:phage-related tail protein
MTYDRAAAATVAAALVIAIWRGVAAGFALGLVATAAVWGGLYLGVRLVGNLAREKASPGWGAASAALAAAVQIPLWILAGQWVQSRMPEQSTAFLLATGLVYFLLIGKVLSAR